MFIIFKIKNKNHNLIKNINFIFLHLLLRNRLLFHLQNVLLLHTY